MNNTIDIFFSDCISNNLGYSIPIGIFFGISLIGNLLLGIKLSCHQERTAFLERELELISVNNIVNTISDNINSKIEIKEQ